MNKPGKTTKQKPAEKAKKSTPTLRFVWIWLSALVLLVYAPSLKNGLTELDDSIFINENHDFNTNLSNLTHAFHRGVFSEKEDTYYRPLLLDSFIINTQFSRDRAEPFHFFNILLHLGAVILLYYLLLQFRFDRTKAFLLTCLFAVHPVLTQAVSWIPGRNDSLLAIFTFGWMIVSLKYFDTHKWTSLLGSFLLLLGALFTKESALFIPFGFFFMLLVLQRIQWKQKAQFLAYGVWILAIAIWWIARSRATLMNEPLAMSSIVHNFTARVPVLIQYFGKTILPFNLSVFPMLRDTSYLFGIIAIVLIAALFWWGPITNKRMILAGFGWFLVMLVPVVILPGALNEQDFEHRLYVPLFGIILALSQTPIFTRLKPAGTALTVGLIALLFIVINVQHQKQFRDPVTFWEAAVKSSPHSGYATMMLAARIDDTDPKRSTDLMLKAYQLDSTQKYINFYIGKMYNDKGETDTAEKYLLEELKHSDYYETYFELSHVAFMHHDMDKSISYMETYLTRAPRDEMAINNYILMLLNTNQSGKARAFIAQKQKEGIIIAKELVDRAGK